jgi:hypothetical protein
MKASFVHAAHHSGGSQQCELVLNFSGENSLSEKQNLVYDCDVGAVERRNKQEKTGTRSTRESKK